VLRAPSVAESAVAFSAAPEVLAVVASGGDEDRADDPASPAPVGAAAGNGDPAELPPAAGEAPGSGGA
jgi:hypothetical protein